MLLIREDMEKLRVLPEDQFIDCIDRMAVWVGDLAQNGNYVSAAEPLGTSGKYVSKERVLSDGPFIEAKEAISGFFIVEADNLEQATAIAQTCPRILDQTALVEVRPIRSLNNI